MRACTRAGFRIERLEGITFHIIDNTTHEAIAPRVIMGEVAEPNFSGGDVDSAGIVNLTLWASNPFIGTA